MGNEKGVIDLLSQIGKVLIQYGAETEVVESGIKRSAKKLGFEDVELLVMPNTIMIYLSSHGEIYHNRLQKVQRQDVNFKALDKVESLINTIKADTDITLLLRELENESELGSMYPNSLRSVMAGVGCASFSLLFGGDLYIFAITFIASFIGFTLNGALLKRYFNPFVVIVAVTFTITLVSGFLSFHHESAHIAIASAVLFLVPSVAFINSVNDLIKGHYTNGLVRGIRGVMISFAIAIGISLALNILGVENFI